jgi:hypothetical protein
MLLTYSRAGREHPFEPVETRAVAERDGGRIWAEPGSEGGSRFRFTLPAEGER